MKSRKLLVLLVVTLLVLSVAPLAMAQGGSDPCGAGDPCDQGNSSGSDPCGAGDPCDQNQPQSQPSGAAQPSASNLDGLMHLNNSELVVDCSAVSDRLTQLKGAQTGDTQAQSELAQIEGLAKLCTDNGFTPASTPAGG